MDLRKILEKDLLREIKDSIREKGLPQTMALIKRKYYDFEISLDDLNLINKLAKESYVKNGKKLYKFTKVVEKCGLNAKDVIQSEPQTYKTVNGAVKERDVVLAQKIVDDMKMDKNIIEFVTRLEVKENAYFKNDEDCRRNIKTEPDMPKKFCPDIDKNIEEIIK